MYKENLNKRRKDNDDGYKIKVQELEVPKEFEQYLKSAKNNDIRLGIMHYCALQLRDDATLIRYDIYDDSIYINYSLIYNFRGTRDREKTLCCNYCMVSGRLSIAYNYFLC